MMTMTTPMTTTIAAAIPPYALRAMPATTLAALIRGGAVSAAAVVEAHIARVVEVNPTLNALVGERFAAAREEARAADAEVAATAPADRAALPPLLGVPVTIKQFLAVAGMAHDVGLVARRGRLADHDATVVSRVRAAGAIILGVSNVPEGGMWMETHNKLHGRTSNPWHARRTAGGSSGGEGALVGAGASALGIGSDIAGSIRIPAAFCGAVGHKPTAQTVPNTGHWGPPTDGAGRYLCIGPIARSVRDAAVALQLIAGPDGEDRATVVVPPSAEALALADPAAAATAGEGSLRGIDVYPVPGHGGLRIHPAVRAQIERAAAALAARGARVRREPRLELLFARSFAVWARAMDEVNAGSPPFVVHLGDGTAISLYRELGLSLVGRSSITFPALMLALLEKLPEAVPRRLRDALPKADVLRDELERILGPAGVLLHPPYTRPAPIHRAALLTPFDFVCTAIFSITELPVTQVPTGLDARGLPLGVQIVARRGNDRLTLAAARAVEASLGGWVPARMSFTPTR
jgi:fatty acid amide hydrolase 2